MGNEAAMPTMPRARVRSNPLQMLIGTEGMRGRLPKPFSKTTVRTRTMTQAIDTAGDRTHVIRFPLRRVVAGLVCVGAAAALVAMLVLAPEPQTPAAGVAQVQVSQPVVVAPSTGRDAGYARVTVSPLPGPPADDGAESSRLPAAEPQLAEVFLMVEPVRVAMGTRGGTNPFGFN